MSLFQSGHVRALIWAGFCCLSEMAGGQESGKEGVEKQAGRPFVELERIFMGERQKILSAKLPYEEEINRRDKLIESFSPGEIALLLEGVENLQIDPWGDALFKRWGYLDPKGAMAKFVAEDPKMTRIYEGAGGLEGNCDESILGAHVQSLLAVLWGWSKKNPQEAWEAVFGSGGYHSTLILLSSGWGYLAPRFLMQDLVKVDPDRAWHAFSTFHHEKYTRLYRESILMGISVGLPYDSKWQEMVEKAMDLSEPDLSDPDEWLFERVIRERLLSRWFEQDPKAAEEWFRSERAERIGVINGEFSLDSAFYRFLIGDSAKRVITYKKEVSLGPTVSHWLGRDLEGGKAWLKPRPAMLREIFLDQRARLDQCISHESARALLVDCLNIEERGRLLHEMMDDTNIFDPLDAIETSFSTRNEMLEHLGELEVEEEIVERIIEKLGGGFEPSPE